jgi:hypothetical protein
MDPTIWLFREFDTVGKFLGKILHRLGETPVTGRHCDLEKATRVHFCIQQVEAID